MNVDGNMGVEQLSMVSVEEFKLNLNAMEDVQECRCVIGLSEGPSRKCTVCTVRTIVRCGENGYGPSAASLTT